MLQDIKNRLKAFKEGDKRNPLEIYFFIKKIFSTALRPIFGEYYDEIWKWGWQVFHLLFIIAGSGICYAFNAYDNRHDIRETSFSICLGLFVFLSLQRISNLIERHESIMVIMKKTESFVTVWEKSSSAHQTLLWYFRLLEKCIIVGITGIWMFGFLIAIGPIIIYFVFGRMQLIYVCYIPMVDYEHHPGFEIHVVMHFWLAFFFCLAVGPIMGMLLLFLAMAGMQADILVIRLSNLGDSLTQNKMLSTENEKELKNIYQEHQQLIEYMKDLEDIFSMQSLCDHFILGTQICLSLFICFEGFWLPGYAIIIVGTSNLLALDLLGTIIEIKFEKLLEEVYEFPWYLMKLKNQKDYLYFFINTQKTDWLTVGGFVSQSLNTFVRLYKGIYSYCMILVRTQT